jgi:hypothetical protein
VGAPWAFERAEVETHASRRDAREHHEGLALWASWAMDAGVYVVGQEIRFLHVASLKGGGSATLPVTGNARVTTLALTVSVRCSILLTTRRMMRLAQHRLSVIGEIFDKLS